MLPRAISDDTFTLRGTEILPIYLSARDQVWLRALLDEYERHRGAKYRSLEERLREPLPVAAPRSKLRVARHLLDRLMRDDTSPALDPRVARRVLFRAAVERDASRDEIIRRVAEALSVTPADLESSLFADLPPDELVGALPGISPPELVLESNLAIACSLLKRSARVVVRAQGQPLALIRTAHRRGLICRGFLRGRDAAELDISGPFSLFRHTALYGRALAALLPRLASCEKWTLEAECALGRGTTLSQLTLDHRDPLPPARDLGAHDPRREERFAKDFAKLAPHWDVTVEPDPIDLGVSLVFPDLELRNRRTGERWLLEIVGFWTREHVERKLRQLDQANRHDVILCLDTTRHCGGEELSTLGHVVKARRRIDARQILAIVEPEALRDVA